MFCIRLKKRADAPSWGVIVGAILAVTVLFIIIYLYVRAGRTGSSILDCEGGQDMCVKTAAECTAKNEAYTLSVKPCRTSASKNNEYDGRCCGPPLFS